MMKKVSGFATLPTYEAWADSTPLLTAGEFPYIVYLQLSNSDKILVHRHVLRLFDESRPNTGVSPVNTSLSAQGG